MKKIVDERGRLFGLISFIDVIVLAAVVILAFATLSKFSANESNPVTTTNTVNVTYTILVPIRRMNEADLLRPGDSLYTDLGTYMGTIKSVSVEEAMASDFLVDGTYVMAKVHERYDITMVVEAQCSFSEGRYYVDRVYELTANVEQWMCTKYSLFTGFIISIET